MSLPRGRHRGDDCAPAPPTLRAGTLRKIKSAGRTLWAFGAPSRPRNLACTSQNRKCSPTTTHRGHGVESGCLSRTCACFSTFAHSTLSSALRSVGGSAPHLNRGSNLPRRQDGSDAHPEWGQEGPPANEGDLSASYPAGPLTSLPPAVGPLCFDQIRFRSELQDTV